MTIGKRLYMLNRQGRTYAEIAEAEGLTKNKVAGHIWRYRQAHGIPRMDEIDKDSRKPPKKYTSPAPKPKPIPEPETDPAPLTHLCAGECRYPVTEGRPYLFCARPCEGTYCAEHKELTTAKPRRK